MNDQHLKISDYVAASMPLAATTAAKTVTDLTLADWNHIAGIVSSVLGAGLGAAYLIWKWRKEAKKADSRVPFQPTKQF